jgi:hypothetical protein
VRRIFWAKSTGRSPRVKSTDNLTMAFRRSVQNGQFV